MGKLSIGFLRNPPNLFRQWTVPFIISVIVVVATNQTFANPAPTIGELTAYLADNNLDIGSQSDGRYERVYYYFGGNMFYLTHNGSNSRRPRSSGRYATWINEVNGAGQIYFYDAITKQGIPLTVDGTNQNPAIDGQRVVWERWINEHWEIYFFDGTTTTSISSSASTAMRPVIKDDEVVFAQYAGGDQWSVVRYRISTAEKDTIKTGAEHNAWPGFRNDGSIRTDFADIGT